MNPLVGLMVLPVAVVQASFFEWIFHRYWLHRPWLPKECFTAHTLVHHQLCKFDDTFEVTDPEQHEALTFQWWGGPLLIAINVAPWAAAWWLLSSFGLGTLGLVTMLTVAATFLLYYIGYEGLHYLMHRPLFPWIQRLGYIRFLERHHRIHHVLMDRNLNVLVPIADCLLGTLVLESSTHGQTSTSARALARRHGRAGRHTRKERAAHESAGSSTERGR